MNFDTNNNDIDDIIENENLKQRLNEFGLIDFQSSFKNIKDENNYLRIVLEQEKILHGEQVKISSIFADSNNFPPVEDLDFEQIRELIEYIENELRYHNIIIDLKENLPIGIKYTYIINHVLNSYKPINTPQNTLNIQDGCNGYCPDCFQLKYCEIGQKNIDEFDDI
jgi:hypothetical protein